ncbi:hypothetical protein GKZ90_0021040 [Flavobacterium sp. MC2016-06]|jgi:hypothetical protein|uniref:hypothetical protein n=1 Tax=Flavobacterium sp. MC2016-06 TaxID=2676308 RepID=UPI0012BA8D88|nr:hypothetical protein [Flavobacterium sp. MC2016-06]MBU3860987.1 hypothetical protein [Flavobacterium sp. MC2016-06]
MLSTTEVRAIAQQVVDESKASAHVDQGTLKRSISYTITKGRYIFRQMYYGFYGEDNKGGINSQLEQNAKRLMPKGIEYQIVGIDFDGKTQETTVLKSGRKLVKEAPKTTKPAPTNKQTTSNLKKLLDTIKKNRAKNGDTEEKKNKGTDTNG